VMKFHVPPATVSRSVVSEWKTINAPSIHKSW
jgi:hypothetical protein